MHDDALPRTCGAKMSQRSVTGHSLLDHHDRGFAMKQPKLIRKYVNRRLYDTTQSRYVNLEDLRRLVVAGSDIRVVEQSTGEEITTTVLLQIIEDNQRSGSRLLQPEFLAQLIRLSDADIDPALPDRLNTALRGAADVLSAA
jgi:polyhydroxyalkanoate synthesis repressor PhaR